MDRLTPQQRSSLMSRIRSTETEPERLLRSCLHRRGYRFRKNVRTLPGRPDIVFAQYAVVVFVDGGFWHGYRLAKWKHSLSAYWKAKIEGNILRDRRNRARLRWAGWRVVRVWDHEVKRSVNDAADRVERVLRERRRESA